MSDKYVREEPMIRGPQFLVRLRSHTVFENTPIKLFCTVEGYPTPVIKWSVGNVISVNMMSIMHNTVCATHPDHGELMFFLLKVQRWCDSGHLLWKIPGSVQRRCPLSGDS